MTTKLIRALLRLDDPELLLNHLIDAMRVYPEVRRVVIQAAHEYNSFNVLASGGQTGARRAGVCGIAERNWKRLAQEETKLNAAAQADRVWLNEASRVPDGVVRSFKIEEGCKLSEAETQSFKDSLRGRHETWMVTPEEHMAADHIFASADPWKPIAPPAGWDAPEEVLVGVIRRYAQRSENDKLIRWRIERTLALNQARNVRELTYYQKFNLLLQLRAWHGSLEVDNWFIDWLNREMPKVDRIQNEAGFNTAPM